MDALLNLMAIPQLVALLVATCAAVTVQQGALLLFRAWPRTESRLAAMMAGMSGRRAAQVSIVSDTPMELEPDNVVLAGLGLPENITMTHLRIAGAVWPLPALLIGVPPLPALAICALSGVMVHSWLAQRWAKFVTNLEEELGPYAGRLHSSLQVTTSVPVALSRSIESLEPGSPLRMWMERLALGFAQKSTPFLIAALPAARKISTSLSLIVLLMERCASSGGAAHAAAFLTASKQMGAVMEARTIAHSKAAKARGTVTIFFGLLLTLAAIMGTQPLLREGFKEPMVQIGIAGSLVWMVVGYLIIQAMIRDALAA